MKIEMAARQAEIDEPLRQWAEKKLAKLEKYLRDEVRVRLVLIGDGHRRRVELQVDHRHGSIHASEEAADARAAITLAVEKAEKQARREHKKFHDGRRRSAKVSGEPAV